jgi:two-component system OmpR family sensor kinase
MSLRARLLAVTVALVAVGLVVASIATFHFTRSFLIDQVDEQLAASRPFAARALSEPADFGPPPEATVALPLGAYAEYRAPDGSVVRGKPLGYPTDQLPELPTQLSELGTDPTQPVTFTTAVGAGLPLYRVMATPLPEGGTLLVASPLTEVQSTLRRLVRIEVAVGIVVLATAAGLALWLVRLGLKPLAGIGETAGSIAAGDLSQRVAPADERTEVGRLGLALNAMLAQIERAFQERQASEERLRRFVADASHELRTPLTSIRGYAELFRRGAGARPEDLEKSMARIETEASRMGILVDDLLLLARLDQGRPLEREPVDLGALANDAADAARAIDPSRPIDVTIDAPAELIGDAGRLRQVIDNLLDNARVHTAEGTPVHVRVGSDEDGVVLAVSDEGHGLSPESRARVFERFYRGDPARSRHTGGAGLGLSIVSAIVDAHGGSVSVPEGEEGVAGATFVVRLPLVPPGSSPAA